MSDSLDIYRAKAVGTNIDPRSLLSTDYFNHFSTVNKLQHMVDAGGTIVHDNDASLDQSNIDKLFD